MVYVKFVPALILAVRCNHDQSIRKRTIFVGFSGKYTGGSESHNTFLPADYLTVDGKADIVVHNAQSYQNLLKSADRAEAIEGIKRGLQDVEAGRTRPFAEFDREMREMFDIPSRKAFSEQQT